MSKPLNRLCCYEADPMEDDIPPTPSLRQPMRTRMEYSKIQFLDLNSFSQEPTIGLLHQLYFSPMLSKDISALLRRKPLTPPPTHPPPSLTHPPTPFTHPYGERDDLEYYIPQLVTYLVIERNLEEAEVRSVLEEACGRDIFFAHQVYFYLKSLSCNHNAVPLPHLCQFIDKQFFLCMDHQEETTQMDDTRKEDHFKDHITQHNQTYLYGCNQTVQSLPLYPPIHTLYPPIHTLYPPKPYHSGFMSVPSFWQEVMAIGAAIEKVGHSQSEQILCQMLAKINTGLPADVYIPFGSQQIREYSILALWKGHIFATKERAPFSIWVEVYNDKDSCIQVYDRFQPPPKSEEVGGKKKKNILSKLYQALSKPFSKKKGNRKTEEESRQMNGKLSKKCYKSFGQSPFHFSYEEERVYSDEMEDKEDRCMLEEEGPIEQTPDPNPHQNDFFPELSSAVIEKRKMKSVYRNLKNWRMIHLFVKTKDDIKQEQFAMQLITLFEYIFRKEKTGCMVFPYEVISLGFDCGLIEMLNDVITFDKLFRKMNERNMTLPQFFQQHFPNPTQAQDNFMRSLAGYSLLSYFLQIKDRHNGNILLHRRGHMIHIDFGFFLSNNPGKGVELEKKMPFKLLSQYVQVIGGRNSEGFFEFRRLFYEGFRAVIRHSETIFSLVQIMYKSHGEIMNCFQRGEETLSELHERLNPTQDIESFCFNLVNRSLDHWRAKWYDKFQYLLQKIYY